MSQLVLGTTGMLTLTSCADEAEDPDVEPDTCALGELLPLQNPRSFTLGETFYLPRVVGEACLPGATDWTVQSAPAGSENRPQMRGTPEPRFTPDVAGKYVLHVPGVDGSELTLTVVDRAPAERFRNHYLTPLYGAARVGDEIWTANGASYTVTRVVRTGDTWQAAGEITVGAWPAAVAWREPLPYAVVAQRGSDTIGFIDRERGVLEDALWVGDEPTGLVISPDVSRLYVSLATMREVVVVDLETREIAARLEVGFDPRALAISADGARLYVASYRSGNRQTDLYGTYGENDDQDLWILDAKLTEETDVLHTLTGVSAEQRAIALSEDGSELYVAGTNVDPVPSQADPERQSFVNEVVVIRTEPGQEAVVRRADISRQPSAPGPVVNPAGILASGDTLWIAAESSNLVVALDRETLEEKARVAVGPGPRQLVALGDGTIAVHCHQDFTLWILDSNAQVVQTVQLTEDPRPADVALGERVFTRPGNNFAVHHACASCHIEAQNEGGVWNFGRGVWANIRPLQLLEATTPMGWNAYTSGAANFGYQGPASILSSPVMPGEAGALQAFLGSLIGAPRATGHTRLDGSYTEAGLRGKALFEGKAGCASCHVPPLYTNRTLIDPGKSGEPADVPTLLGVYRHGVYFIKGQARTLDDAVDVAVEFVGASLTADERADLIAFLYQLTAKGAAPRAMWPDIDSAAAVYPEVKPWIELGEPIDDTRDGRSAAEVAAEYVILEDASGSRVPAAIEITGTRVVLTPAAPLARGSQYRFRVLPGLPFLHGGTLEAERSTRFTVAQEPVGTLDSSMRMLVTTTGPMGPVDMPLLLSEITTGTDALALTVVPELFGVQQRQPLWARIDGDRFLMQPFALPVGPVPVADASKVEGMITEVDPQGRVLRIEGTLRISGPAIDLPGVPFVITPVPAQGE